MDLRGCWQSGHKKTRSGPVPWWTGPWFVLLLWICFSCSTGAADKSVENASFSVLYNATVTMKNQTIYGFVLNETRGEVRGVRVSVKTLSQASLPILVDVRQEEAALSFLVPLFLRGDSGDNQTYPYAHVARTLCLPSIEGPPSEHKFFVDVSTLSVQGIRYQLRVSYVDDFTLQTGKKQTFTASPSQPQYFKYVFPKDVSAVIVNISSVDNKCTVLSIQDIQCPVYDLNTNVDFIGSYQTITKRGAITVQKKDFPTKSFHMVVVVKPDDKDCGNKDRPKITDDNILFNAGYRAKELQVVVSRTIKQEDYNKGIWLCVGIFLSFYPLTFLVGCLEACFKRERHPLLVIIEYHRQGSNCDVSTPIVEEAHESVKKSEEDENKKFLFLSDHDLTCHYSEYKKNAYIWNIFTIAVFYGQPVIQLLMGYQTVFNITGRQDICYHNFLCAHPLESMRAFNNVLSNLGYFLLGLLFNLIVGIRHLRHRALSAVQNNCGIYKQFGLFYAMGTALMMEGLLSSGYHLCPKDTNFQFDTSFMYMIAGLSMLQLYLKRHPDISAHYFFFLVALVLIFVLGLEFSDRLGTEGEWVFRSIFSLIHILFVLFFTIHLYYTSRWTKDSGFLCRVKCCMLNVREPPFIHRVVLLVLAITVNIIIVLKGLITKLKDYNHHLLIITISNLLFYFGCYIFMKWWNKELQSMCRRDGINWLKLVIISIFTAVACGFALYFFGIALIEWKVTPAESRELNKDCYLLSFYDHHDVWHFLSAITLFGTFLVLLIIDDNLDDVPRNKIRVF